MLEFPLKKQRRVPLFCAVERSETSKRGAHAAGRKQARPAPARTRAGTVVVWISSAQRENLQRVACAGTDGDSSEEGQLRPGLSESIACLPSVATHGGARPHVPLRHFSVTPEETTGQNAIIQPHLSRKSFGTPRRTAMGSTDRIHRQPLGLTPWAGERCPDPERLSTVGISGLCP